MGLGWGLYAEQVRYLTRRESFSILRGQLQRLMEDGRPNVLCRLTIKAQLAELVGGKGQCRGHRATVARVSPYLCLR